METAMDQGRRIAESIIATKKLNVEHQHLRSVVVEKAKEFTSNEEARPNWDALVAYRELCGAIDALVAFERKHGII